MKITEKGQVTIPLDIRIQYGFLPHTEVGFVAEEGRIYIVKDKSKQKRGVEIVKHMRGRGSVKITTAELMKMTRGDDE